MRKTVNLPSGHSARRKGGVWTKTSELTRESVLSAVERGSVGVYRLYKEVGGRQVVRYVGRSDRDLRRRLLRHAVEGRYDRFSFEVSGSILAAFCAECREWHFHDGLDNILHPCSPGGLPYKCPYCAVRTEFSHLGAGEW